MEEHSPRGKALRTRKALCLVSVAWYAAAVPYLYRDIAILYVGQLAALANSLRTAPDRLAPLVKSLAILCYIPRSFETAACEDLSFIMHACSSLQSISFNDTRPLHQIDRLRRAWTDIPAHVTALAVDADRWFTEPSTSAAMVLPGLPHFAFEKIVSLSINTTFFDPRELLPTQSAPSRSTFPFLKTLCIRGKIPAVMRDWVVPHLQCVKLYEYPGTDHLDVEWLVRNGEEIACLVAMPCRSALCKCLLEDCDALKHVIIGGLGIGPVAIGFLNGLCDDDQRRHKVNLDVCNAPKLWKSTHHWLVEGNHGWKKVRWVDETLVDTMPELPQLLPPEEDVKSVRIHDVFGLRIAQNDVYIFGYDQALLTLVGIPSTLHDYSDDEGSGTSSSTSDSHATSSWYESPSPSQSSDADSTWSVDYEAIRARCRRAVHARRD